MVSFIQFFYTLTVCFHVVLRLYFASAVGKVSSVDFFPFFFSAKAQYKGQLFNIKEIIFKCDFSITKQKNSLASFV